MSLLTDLAEHLQDQGVGVHGKTIFTGPRPANPDACVTLQTYGGDPPSLHDARNRARDERLAVQVVARGSRRNQAEAEQLAKKAYDAIPFRHATLASGTRYDWCKTEQTPFSIGSDQTDRPLVAFNVTLRRST